MGEQQNHKGMFVKHGGRGGAKLFLQCHGGKGATFTPFILGRGELFFAKPPPPAINNELNLIFILTLIVYMYILLYSMVNL